MLEKIKDTKDQSVKELTEAKLNEPFKQRFKALVYLKQRNDADQATTAIDIYKKSILNVNTAQSFLRQLEQINMVEEKSKNKFYITKKGEQFLFEAILPIFSDEQKIARKIFFGEKLLEGEKINQEKHRCLNNAFANLIRSSIPWFKGWLTKEFGKYMAFEEWFLVFEKEHVVFLKQQLESEKKRIINQSKKW